MSEIAASERNGEEKRKSDCVGDEFVCVCVLGSVLSYRSCWCICINYSILILILKYNKPSTPAIGLESDAV